MNTTYSVIGLPTGIIRPGDPMAGRVVEAATKACGGFRNGDILVLAETAVATAEGNVIRLSEISPSERARDLAERYRMDPATAEVVLRESDSIIGGIPGSCSA